jgi:hypothetical protein
LRPIVACGREIVRPQWNGGRLVRTPPADDESPRPMTGLSNSHPVNPAKSKWADFPDPARFQTYYWPDGFTMSYREHRATHAVEIRFGDGSNQDQPMVCSVD